jgi:hypothetical protein
VLLVPDANLHCLRRGQSFSKRGQEMAIGSPSAGLYRVLAEVQLTAPGDLSVKGTRFRIARSRGNAEDE